MNVVAILANVRKKKSTDTLVDEAIKGLLKEKPDAKVKKIYLVDQHIEYCKNCLTCRESKTTEALAKCSIRDDMDIISQDILAADALILATPIHMGFAAAPMMTFLERVCWTFSKPEGKILTIDKCPVPRLTGQSQKMISIVTAGVVPPIYRRLCDQATGLFKDSAKYAFNAKFVGDLYAGAIETRGLDRYIPKARQLGAKLAR